MKTTALWLLALIAVTLVGCAETAAPRTVIDPEADQALRSMCGLLKSAPTFHFQVNAAKDTMSPSGQLVQVTHESNVLVRRPNCIAAEVTTEDGQRSLRYKGKTLALLDLGRKQYATAAVPGNIDAMFDFLFDEYDLTLPLADLLFSDPYPVLTENVQTGVYVGLHVIAGRPCHHLLFTQENIDWQVWIDAGERPLPMRVVITYKQDPYHPQYVADLSDWDLQPAVDAAAFDFKKPADAELVDMKNLLGPKAGLPGGAPGTARDRQEPMPSDETDRVALLSFTDFGGGSSGMEPGPARVILTGFDDNMMLARGGGQARGGGGRSAGGGGRSASSGGGGRSTIRYSGGGGGGSYRPSAPAVRPSTPMARPSSSNFRYSSPSMARPNTGVAQRPNHYGSLLNQPTRAIEKPIGGGGFRQAEGSGGRAMGGVRGSGATVANGIRGPGGFWMAGGRGSAGAVGVAGRGPYGYQSYISLPGGSAHVHWHGSSYWRNGWSWYQPYYYGDTLYYGACQPPVGWVVPDDYAAELQENASIAAINNQNYYYYRDSWYAAQNGKYVAVANPTDAPVAQVVLNPQAMDQLQRMSDFLATVKACSVTIHEASDEILDSGQKVQVESVRTVAVRAPDRMAVDYVADSLTRRSVYDGKTITAYEKGPNQYSQQAMPPTLAETIDTLESKYGMATPVAELLRPGLLDRLKPQLQSADYVGLETINGAKCHHVSFRMDWADCQFWIQDGDQPLPRKLVITYKKVPSTPKYVMTFLGWDLTSPPNSAFAMALPADAKKIEMAPLETKE